AAIVRQARVWDGIMKVARQTTLPDPRVGIGWVQRKGYWKTRMNPDPRQGDLIRKRRLSRDLHNPVPFPSLPYDCGKRPRRQRAIAVAPNSAGDYALTTREQIDPAQSPDTKTPEPMERLPVLAGI